MNGRIGIGMDMHYKFLDSSDVDKVMHDGTVIISSLEYFRELEEKEWAGVADHLEGASELTTGELVVRESSPELALVNNANIGLGMFSKGFVSVSDGGVVNMSNMRFVHAVPNLFIYSASWGNLKKLTEQMCVKAPRRYDACLRIKNFGRLARRIFETGKIVGVDCRVSDAFQRGQTNLVDYESRSRSIDQGPVIVPSAFKKAPKFSLQSEARITFVPKQKMDSKRLTVQISEPHTIFEEIFRNFDQSENKPDALRREV